MRFAEQINFVNDLTQSEGKRDTLIKQSLNQAQDELAGWWRWPFLLTQYALQTVAAYTTGTVDVTNGSRTISGTNTVWTRAMVGRKFRLTSSSAIYRITGFTSSTSLTLDRPFGETTATGTTYSVYKDEYLLAADLDTSKLFTDPTQHYAGTSLSDINFDIYDPANQSTGRLRYLIQVGRTIVPFTSQVGTVTVNSGSRSLTGSSTTWLTVPEGLTRGTVIRIGTALYHVKSIDSDTALTLYELASASVSGSSDWAFQLHHQLMVQINPIPDRAQEIAYRGYRRCQLLVDDGDVSDIPESWHWLMNKIAIRTMYSYTGEGTRFQLMNTECEKGIAQMVEAIGRVSAEQRFRMRSSDERVTLEDPASVFHNTVSRLA